MGIGHVGDAARRQHAHHRVVELDPDLDQRRASHRVDPERPAHLLAQLLRERLVDQREERLRPRRRQLGDRQEVDHEAELLLRDAAQLRVIRLLRIELVHLDQGRDILHHASGQPLSDEIVMALHEHEGDHGLQDHHRRNDDQ